MMALNRRTLIQGPGAGQGRGQGRAWAGKIRVSAIRWGNKQQELCPPQETETQEPGDARGGMKA